VPPAALRWAAGPGTSSASRPSPTAPIRPRSSAPRGGPSSGARQPATPAEVARYLDLALGVDLPQHGWDLALWIALAEHPDVWDKQRCALAPSRGVPGGSQAPRRGGGLISGLVLLFPCGLTRQEGGRLGRHARPSWQGRPLDPPGATSPRSRTSHRPEARGNGHDRPALLPQAWTTRAARGNSHDVPALLPQA